MAKDNIDVSNDLGSLLDELSKVRREEEVLADISNVRNNLEEIMRTAEEE